MSECFFSFCWILLFQVCPQGSRAVWRAWAAATRAPSWPDGILITYWPPCAARWAAGRATSPSSAEASSSLLLQSDQNDSVLSHFAFVETKSESKCWCLITWFLYRMYSNSHIHSCYFSNCFSYFCHYFNLWLCRCECGPLEHLWTCFWSRGERYVKPQKYIHLQYKQNYTEANLLRADIQRCRTVSFPTHTLCKEDRCLSLCPVYKHVSTGLQIWKTSSVLWCIHQKPEL